MKVERFTAGPPPPLPAPPPATLTVSLTEADVNNIMSALDECRSRFFCATNRAVDLANLSSDLRVFWELGQEGHYRVR